VDGKKRKVVVPLLKSKSRSDSSSDDKLCEQLGEQFAHMNEISKPVTVMLLEVDDFDGLNKVFGPNRCGRMLEEVASILKQSLRTSDLVTFYGNQQFGLVLKGTGPRVAYEVGERIRVAIKEAAFAPEHGHVLKISISCGHATQTQSKGVPFNTPHDLIAAALECLREARESGQDRVVGYRFPLASLDFPEAKAKD